MMQCVARNLLEGKKEASEVIVPQSQTLSPMLGVQLQLPQESSSQGSTIQIGWEKERTYVASFSTIEK